MPDFRSGGHARVRDLCRRLRPLIGPQMDRIYAAYSAEDSDGKKQIEAYLEALAARHLSGDLESEAVHLVPPAPELLDGPYKLGTVEYAGKTVGPFGLRTGDWIQHVGVFGRSGAGKTNLGFEIFRQLHKDGTPVLVFDWKRNYRDLLALPDFQDVDVHTVGRDIAPFYFNPLIPPPDTEPRIWLKQIIEVVAQAYALGNGVLYLLQESLNAVYEKAGVYEGKVTQWPTFRDVLVYAKERNARGRESAWLASTMRALSTLCFGEMDKTLNSVHRQSKTLDQMLDKSVILEMDALGQSDKVFLISSLLLYIHHRRMTEGMRETLKHVTIIEEAHHVLANERRSLIGGQSVMEITFREIREFGEGIVYLDQHPSKIALSALGNTYCTFCLNLKHQKDVYAMAQSMLLDGEEKDIFGSLEVGYAVVKLQGRATQPFLLRIPEFEVAKGTVTDNALRLRMALAALASDVVGPEEGENDDLLASQSQSMESPAPIESSAPEQNPVETAFLDDVAVNPDSGVAARYKRLGLSVRQGQKLKTKLVAHGLLEEEETRTSTGRVRVIRLTEQGRQVLDNGKKAVA